MGESHGTGVGAAGFAGADGLAAAGVADAAAAGLGGGEAGADAAPSAGFFTSAWTEPEPVAFTPPGTAGLSADGFGSPSGGGEEGDFGSSGIAWERANLRLGAYTKRTFTFISLTIRCQRAWRRGGVLRNCLRHHRRRVC